MQVATGFLLALLIAAAAHALGSLSRSGAVAALVLGTVIYGFGGWQAALLLICFFVSSSFLGRHAVPKQEGTETRYAKGAERDAGQVMGNGCVAGGLVIALMAHPTETWIWAAYAGAIAAVNADTWATELGALSSKTPRLITRLEAEVARGTSGGVTALGTGAAVLGAAVIGALAALLSPARSLPLFLAVTLGGAAGALFDSVLGATFQAMYRCTLEGTETEQFPTHRCGAATVQVRGWGWLNNDWVNFGCSVMGALVAAALSVASSAH